MPHTSPWLEDPVELDPGAPVLVNSGKLPPLGSPPALPAPPPAPQPLVAVRSGVHGLDQIVARSFLDC